MSVHWWKQYTSLVKNKYFQLTEYPGLILQDRLVDCEKSEGSDFLIPNNLYQKWETPTLPKTLYKSVSRFRDLNPDINFFLFDSKAAEEYLKHWKYDSFFYKLYKESCFGPMKADIFRYCILYDRGGYYCDINKGCSSPLRKLHRSSDTALLSFEKNICLIPYDTSSVYIKYPNNKFCQWLFGFTPQHKILEMMLDDIKHNYLYFKDISFENPKEAILNYTGPDRFTYIVRQYLKNRDNPICIADVNFYGYGCDELDGSKARYAQKATYKYEKNKCIVCSNALNIKKI